jgi:hypothetical protein
MTVGTKSAVFCNLAPYSLEDIEDEGSIFLQNFSNILQYYTATHSFFFSWDSIWKRHLELRIHMTEESFTKIQGCIMKLLLRAQCGACVLINMYATFQTLIYSILSLLIKYKHWALPIVYFLLSALQFKISCKGAFKCIILYHLNYKLKDNGVTSSVQISTSLTLLLKPKLKNQKNWGGGMFQMFQVYMAFHENLLETGYNADACV